MRLARTGHTHIEGESRPQIVLSEDGLGTFISVASTHRGDVRWVLRLKLAEPLPAGEIDAWAIEMVHVPAGAFELDDDHPEALGKGSFHRLGEDGRPSGTYRVLDEQAVKIDPFSGSLFYSDGKVQQYQGDQRGPIPAEYPKGTRAMYVMKYEMTQGEYARFLNAMPAPWREQRMPSFDEQQEAATCTIINEGGQVIATKPCRPLNFVTRDDSLAWMDWMCLRPMTEFEFEKAARGARRPVAGDFPWGTDSRNGVDRIVTPTRDVALNDDESERVLSAETRVRFAASTYWIMDLSGSMWERVVTAGHADGRAFKGSHGDGVLDDKGNAINADWPRGNGDTDAPATSTIKKIANKLLELDSIVLENGDSSLCFLELSRYSSVDKTWRQLLPFNSLIEVLTCATVSFFPCFYSW